MPWGTPEVTLVQDDFDTWTHCKRSSRKLDSSFNDENTQNNPCHRRSHKNLGYLFIEPSFARFQSYELEFFINIRSLEIVPLRESIKSLKSSVSLVSERFAIFSTLSEWLLHVWLIIMYIFACTADFPSSIARAKVIDILTRWNFILVWYFLKLVMRWWLVLSTLWHQSYARYVVSLSRMVMSLSHTSNTETRLVISNSGIVVFRSRLLITQTGRMIFHFSYIDFLISPID